MRRTAAKSIAYFPLDTDVELDALKPHTQWRKPFDSTSLRSFLPWKRVPNEELWEGWRFGASLGASTSYFVLVLNVVVTIWASRRTNESGSIFEGSCEVAKHINLGAHLTINVLSTLLLGASNYSMQCLSAPTRMEIDAAHRKGRWMDIGVQSLRNLRYIRPFRVWLWAVLAITSIPLHLFYNSMLYMSTTNNAYGVYIVSEAWLLGAQFNNSVFSLDAVQIQRQVRNNLSQFEVMDGESCIGAYSRSFISGRSDVILVSDYCRSSALNPFCNSSLHFTSTYDNSLIDSNALLPSRYDNPVIDSDMRVPYPWICSIFSDEGGARCDESKARKKAEADEWTVYDNHIIKCLSLKVEETCTINFNLPIGLVVIFTNLGKAFCITFVCLFLIEQPLITLGDTISSFLERPDETTIGHCLVSRADIQDGSYDVMRRHKLPKKYFRQYLYRFNALGRRSWISFFFFLSLCIFSITVLLIYAAVQLKGFRPGSSAIFTLGFGTANSYNLITGWLLPESGADAVLVCILIANCPQLILSGLYLALNNIITRFQLVTEWESYARVRKALRVSHLRNGQQRSTYFLQIPYRLSLPLMTFSALLHWLVSQSIFLASVKTVNMVQRRDDQLYYFATPDGQDEHVNEFVTCGYSPIAMMCVLGAALVMAVFVYVMGRGEVVAKMPLVSTCSLGVAAACHPPEDGADWEKPLLWGSVPEKLLTEGSEPAEEGDERSEKKVGHCSFSSGRVDVPVEGCLYA